MENWRKPFIFAATISYDMNTPFTYELLEISWMLDYDLTTSAGCYVNDDNTICEDNNPSPTELDADGIPVGPSIADIRQRESIISQYMHQWSESHPDRKVHNKALGEYIHIKGKSIGELLQHSSKSYLSTKAVMRLEEVLEEAVPQCEVPAKSGTAKQKEFMHLIVMSYEMKGIGVVKVTVGVKRSNQEKVQYGMTVLRQDQPLVDPKLMEKGKQKRHKKISTSRGEMLFLPRKSIDCRYLQRSDVSRGGDLCATSNGITVDICLIIRCKGMHFLSSNQIFHTFSFQK